MGSIMHNRIIQLLILFSLSFLYFGCNLTKENQSTIKDHTERSSVSSDSFSSDEDILSLSQSSSSSNQSSSSSSNQSSSSSNNQSSSSSMASSSSVLPPLSQMLISSSSKSQCEQEREYRDTMCGEEYLPIDSLNTVRANSQGMFFVTSNYSDFGACAYCYMSTSVQTVNVYITDSGANVQVLPADSIEYTNTDIRIIHFNFTDYDAGEIMLDSILYEGANHKEMYHINTEDTLNVLRREYYNCPECGSV